MKPFYFLFVSVAFFSYIFIANAQEPLVNEYPSLPEGNTKLPNSHKNKKGYEGWYWPTQIIKQKNTSTTFNYESVVVFPDSTTFWRLSGTDYRIGTIAIGQNLDPYAQLWEVDGDHPLPVGTPYRIDTIGIQGWYFRNYSLNNTVDTIQIEVVHASPYDLTTYSIYTFQNNGDSAISILINANKNKQFGFGCPLASPTRQVYKYKLTLNDTTSRSKWYFFPVNIQAAANEVIGINISFLPGYTYNLNDLVFNFSSPNLNKNIFLFKKQKDNAEVSYVFASPTIHFNNTQQIEKMQRYQQFPYGSVYNTMTAVWRKFGWDVAYKLSLGGTNINTITNSNITIFPNPANDKIILTLNNNQPATITFSNIYGQTVKTIEVANNNATIDVSNLSSGVYFIHVVQNHTSFTQKIIINR